jgi:hypothetical protein
MKLNIYLITANSFTYDTFDSAVVIASSEENAKRIHPYGSIDQWGGSSWVTSPDDVAVQLIGLATKDAVENTVVCNSFNAG